MSASGHNLNNLKFLHPITSNENYQIEIKLEQNIFI